MELKSLKVNDIHSGDHAMISTVSGNRYMLRHSQSRGKLLIYNHREGRFSAESGHPFMIRRGTSVIAELGKSLDYFAIINEMDGTGNAYSSTPVRRIEVRCGLEVAIAHHITQDKTGLDFGEIAQALRKEASPKRRGLSSDESGVLVP